MFTTGVTTSNEDTIDILFGDKTPGADNLIGGKESQEEKTEKVSTQDQNQSQLSAEEEADILFDNEDSDKEENVEEKVVEKKQEKTTTKKVAETTKTLPDNVDVDYQAIYQKMVEDGVWEEVEVPDDVEWSKDTFLQIQKLQAETKYEDLLSRTGTIGKSIIEFEQNGGNPSELLGLFREQKDIRDYDISNTDGQEEFLAAYLQSQGNSEKSIERTLRSLRDQGGDVLKEEAEEKKTLWDAQYNEEIENRKKAAALEAQQIKEATKNFENVMMKTITSDTQVTPKERKELQSYVLDYSQSYRGQKVSQFYVDMAEVQKNPENYIELAKFVKGLKTGEYVKKVVDKVKKETAASSFLKIKNGATLRTSSGSPEIEKQSSSNFVTMLSRNK